MNKQAYSPEPTQKVDGWKLIHHTKTLKFYKKRNTILIAIRGTNVMSLNDISADVLLSFNRITESQRYKKDKKTIEDFQHNHAHEKFMYVATGHSLGGALVDAFLKDGLIKAAVTFNPAVQPIDFKQKLSNERIYIKSDPLYALMGRYAKSKLHSREVKQFIPGTAGKIYNLLESHQLGSF